MSKMSRAGRPRAHDDSSDEGKSRDKCLAVAFGLSKADFDKLVQVMLAVVLRVGCGRHSEPIDVVYDAFVAALSKPISERPPSGERERLFAWLCVLTEYAALTNRKSKHQRVYASTVPDSVLDALMLQMDPSGRIEARDDLYKAFESLDGADKSLLEAHFVDDRSLRQLAREQGLSSSTLQSRYDKAIATLRNALTALGRRPLRRVTVAIVPFFIAIGREASAHVGAAYGAVVRQCTRFSLRYVIGAALGTGLVIAPMSPSSSTAAVAETPPPLPATFALASSYQKRVAVEIEAQQPDGVPAPARSTASERVPVRKALRTQVAPPPEENPLLWLEWMTFNERRHTARATKRISLPAQ